MKKCQIIIVDYGVGNLRSLARAFEHFGADVEISEDASRVRNADTLVLPGDGAFASGMDGLKVRNLTSAVLDFANSKKPILGICLGAQVLMSSGLEFGNYTGLNLIPGKVIKFDKGIKDKVPQIGWNGIYPKKKNSWKGTILDGVKPWSSVYFIHSYITATDKESNVLAKSNYGGQEFSSVIYDGKIYGCQFHPEKSSDIGLKIIKNFIKLASK